MRIKVYHFWQDVNGRSVKPGEQDVDSVLANYLIANEHAVAIDNDGRNHSKAIVQAMVTEKLTTEDDVVEAPALSPVEQLRADYAALAGEPAKKSWSKNKLQLEIKKLQNSDA